MNKPAHLRGRKTGTIKFLGRDLNEKIPQICCFVKMNMSKSPNRCLVRNLRVSANQFLKESRN